MEPDINMEVADFSELPPIQKSNPTAQVPPFPILIGEYPRLLSKTANGNAMVTNFRFCVCERRSFINIPLMMIGELFVFEAAKRLRVGCKDGSTYCCSFATVEDCTMCINLLRELTVQPTSAKALFAYRFYQMANYKNSLKISLPPAEAEQVALCQPVSESFAYTFGKEVERLGFDTSRRRIWRMSHANELFTFCATYPKYHILPATVDDDQLKICTDFRASKRFPSVVWRDNQSGMVLVRSSQPLSSFLGLSYFQNQADLFLLEEIVNACNKDRLYIALNQNRRADRAIMDSELGGVQEPWADLGLQQGENNSNSSLEEDGAQGSIVDSGVSNGHGASNGVVSLDENTTPKKLAIVDCRSLAGVWGNSFKGGGTEDEAQYKCNMIFLDLANIHAVRDSFTKLRSLCHTYVEGTFYKQLTGCQWMNYISAILRGADIVVDLMHVKKRPVLVHCSDGWDRTSQIVSLAEIMMDSYYRTLEGFQVVVEKEWIHFGHKFGERLGHDPNCADMNQYSPIFIQFLDCVYQLTLQYPAEFQFTEAYLVKLLHHAYSCLFGNFLHNCEQERAECKYEWASVWNMLKPENLQFINPLYKPTSQPLTAKYSEHDIVLWKSVYMAGLRQSPWPHTDFDLDAVMGGEEGAEGIPRSKSMENLSKASQDSGRRNSDPTAVESAAAASLPGSNHNTSTSSAELLEYPEDTPSPPATTAAKSSQTVGDETPTRPVKETVSAPTKLGVVTEVEGVQNIPSDGARANASELQATGDGNEANSINGAGQAMLNDSNTQALGPQSSAVFGEERVPAGTIDPSLRCDDDKGSSNMLVGRADANVLSQVDKLSTLSGQAVGDTTAGMDPSKSQQSPAVYPADLSPTKGYSNQTSLLAERLATTGKGNDVETDNAPGDNQHSRKSQDGGLLTTTHPGESQDPRHQNSDSSPGSMSHVNGKGGKPSLSPRMDGAHAINGTSPHKPSANGAQAQSSNAESDRTNGLNSASTDTLKEELESGGGDSHASANTNLTKPLEVNTKHDRMTVTPPLTTSSSLTSLVTSSPAKRDSQSDLSTETTLVANTGSGTNLMSRRARAASGASRDLSVSPCTCRGTWSDTGRLRNPSGGEVASRRLIGASVSTSTTDISDSSVAKPTKMSFDPRQPVIKQHIDTDGLTLFRDERQELLTELISEKDRKINDLEARLMRAIDVIKSMRSRQQQQLPPSNLPDEFLVTDSDGGEMNSLGAQSNAASDVSWETIDEDEAKMVLWVPDSAVTHCAGCDGLFWIGRRKHHCRNCGKVFCADCSNYMAPVPHQHLNKPERVCRRCHSHLLQLSPGASSDGRIMTLVADG